MYKPGYWAGMPPRLKARIIFWSIYWAFAAWMVTLGSLIGVALIVLPVLWFLAKAWVLDSFLELDDSRVGLLDYSLDYIWNASTFTRSFFLITSVTIALGGLGWLGTEDLRNEAAEPTLIERISDGASDAADATAQKTGAAIEATKETTQGWMDRAKGWFGNDELSDQ